MWIKFLMDVLVRIKYLLFVWGICFVVNEGVFFCFYEYLWYIVLFLL